MSLSGIFEPAGRFDGLDPAGTQSLANAMHSAMRVRVQGDRIWFKTLFAATFFFFLAATIISRIAIRVGGHRGIAVQRVRKSVFAEAKASTSTAVCYAFMG